MPCPFYGRHAVALTRMLIGSQGNQCALIFQAYTPCRMEIDGKQPDLETCEFNGSERAVEVAKFQRIPESLQGREYPD